jgi:hypothetical protein
MRFVPLLSLFVAALCFAPSVSAQGGPPVPVRFFGDAPALELEVFDAFEPEAWATVCPTPCETEIAPGKYRLRIRAGAATDAVRPRLSLYAPADVFVERVNLSQKRRRQRIMGIVFASLGVALIVPGAVAARCVARRDATGAHCHDQFVDGLAGGGLSLALGGLFLGLSFGPEERFTLSTYAYGTVR